MCCKLHFTCGNLWEWCQDWFIRDRNQIPKDGKAYTAPTGSKVLRGSCHHNVAVHCTNTMRYEIPPDNIDGCIGFRIALSLNND
ncbi:formylglycine-generating enzyme family protein [Mucilaginibacter angelicae]|uniref:Formylglycine-generating enzyme family protein n=1 Tax=Mucilaginibacter angelicae TaxID=869718 RepID=A0ABV6L5L4_9SPHI